MPDKCYDHYLLLSRDDLILIIEKRDKEIKGLTNSFKNIKKERDKYRDYNQFHMEEISRLDKVIGKYKGIR